MRSGGYYWNKIIVWLQKRKISNTEEPWIWKVLDPIYFRILGLKYIHYLASVNCLSGVIANRADHRKYHRQSMPSIINVTETDGHLIKAVVRFFHGFTVPVSESVAELILQYAADNPLDGNVWTAISLHLHSRRPDQSNRIFSSTSFYS
jgi:hypothetical protein